MPSRNRWLISIFMPLLLAGIVFSNLVHEPRLAAIKNIDIVRLIACGMCIGVALCGLFGMLRSRTDKA